MMCFNVIQCVAAAIAFLVTIEISTLPTILIIVLQLKIYIAHYLTIKCYINFRVVCSKKMKYFAALYCLYQTY